MIKYTLAVDGMMCGMCEAHVNGAVRRTFAVKEGKFVPGQKTGRW